MNFRTLALSALTLAVLAPAAIVSPASARTDAHSCIFRPMSDRDGTWCNPFGMGNAGGVETHGLKAAKAGKPSLQYYIDLDTRGQSMNRN